MARPKKSKTASPLVVEPVVASVTLPLASESEKTILVTRDGLEKLKEELQYLKAVRRKEVAERIREAISYGDLSENSEYEEAKNEQAFLEGRILELEEKVKNAKIIDDRHRKTAAVQIGSRVVIQNLGKMKKEEAYTIVGSTEADPLNYKVSNESPVGRALLERRVGDMVKVTAPGGIMQYKIIRIE